MLFIPKRGLSPYVPKPVHNVQSLISHRLFANSKGRAEFTLNSSCNFLVINVGEVGTCLLANVNNGIIETIDEIHDGDDFFIPTLNQNGIYVNFRVPGVNDSTDIAVFQYGGSTENHNPLTYISHVKKYGNSPLDIPSDCNVIVIINLYRSDENFNYVGASYVYYKRNNQFIQSTQNLNNSYDELSIGIVDNTINISGNDMHRTPLVVYFA